jgi:hypothetical protein
MNSPTTKDFEDIRTALQKSLDEYVALSSTAQDEMLKLANQQLEACRQLSEFAVKNQENLLTQFELASRNTSRIWLDGVKTWSGSLPGFPGFAG